MIDIGLMDAAPVQDSTPSTDHGHAPKLDKPRRIPAWTKRGYEQAIEVANGRTRMAQDALAMQKRITALWQRLAVAASVAFVVLGVWTW